MFKRRGYKGVKAGGFDVKTARGTFNIHKGLDVVHDLYDETGDKVLKSAVGKTLEFTKI